MNAERWRQVKRIYNGALELESDQRDTFLHEACAGDVSLRKEIDRLLSHQAEAEDLFGSPAIEVTAKALARDQQRIMEPSTASNGQGVALECGTLLGPYEIVALIGAGGMGQVYKARDTRLERLVAVKVLPPALASDPERRHRLEQEARAVSALNHPHICILHDIGSCPPKSAGAPPIDYLVMELVEGQTLAERLRNGPMPTEQTLEYGAQIADALGRAHSQGIVHRDLKPANIMLTESGAKLLDFGLAKLKGEAAEGAGGIAMLATAGPATSPGAVLGTVPYMAPEQVEGKGSDSRSDIFAFGAVLYEMLTGRRAFEGESAASIAAAILEREPPSIYSLQPGTPPALERLIAKCLQKKPEARWQSAADLAGELHRLALQTKSDHRLRFSVHRWALAGAVVVPAAVALLTLWRTGLWPGDLPANWNDASFTPLTRASGIERSPSLSPDGEYVAYEARGDIYRLRLGGDNAENLTEDSPADDTQPAFSPDGRRIAFRSERDGGGIYVMAAKGGPARRICSFGFNPSWSPDGKELVIGSEEIETPVARSAVAPAWIVTVATGEKRQLGDHDAVQPAWSPHGLRIAYWTTRQDIWTMRKDGTNPVAATSDLDRDWNPVWSPDGQFLYFVSNRSGSDNIWRVPIDEESGRVQGAPEPVTRGGSGSRLYPTLSGDGKRIAYSDSVYSSCIYRVPFDPINEKVTGPAKAITHGSRLDSHPALSPDGSTLAFMSSSPTEEIWAMQTDGSKGRQLTPSDHFMDRIPRWSPDGKQIAFYSGRSGSSEVWTVNADGADLRQITNCGAEWPFWFPDGLRILYSKGGSMWSLDATRAFNDQEPSHLTDSRLLVCSWSSDGRDRLAAFFWPDPGIVVYSIPDGKVEPITDFGVFPEWLSDDRRLLFRDGPAILPGGKRLFLADTRSREVREVSEAPAGSFFLSGIALSPDNRTLYYPLLTAEADLWMLTRR